MKMELGTEACNAEDQRRYASEQITLAGPS